GMTHTGDHLKTLGPLVFYRVSLFILLLLNHRQRAWISLIKTLMSDSEPGIADIFQEPADFYQPEKEPTFASHKLRSGEEVQFRLVGHNPLWVRKYPYLNLSQLVLAFLRLYSQTSCFIWNSNSIKLSARNIYWFVV